ncbi:MAG: ABC transporter permease [Clostridiales bacterium]|nr:ABC transporter permease [Clostridiales bacterium]
MTEFIFSEEFLQRSVVFALPILFAAFAALISNRAGIVNINIEGSMSVAAVCGTLASHFSGSWLIGLIVAMLVGVAMSMILAGSALVLRTDSFLSGIALNTFATGLSVYILYAVLEVKGDSSSAPAVAIPNISVPLLRDIPVIGKLLFDQSLLFYIAIACTAVLVFLLNKTKLGTEIRATGFNPEAAESVGINTKLVKTKALIICGLFSGLGGAFLSMSYLQYFSAGMVSGRGFIGIAAEAMGAGKPVLTALFSLLFGAVTYFSVGAQTVIAFPYQILNTFPYIMTLIAMIIYAVINKNKLSKK